MNEDIDTTDLSDEFPDTAARRAVVALVRGFGMLQRQMAPYFAQFGLTPPQFQMLTVINRLSDEPITQRRLARELYVSFPNITVMLTRLEDSGFIERNPHPDDGRAKIVRLTQRGKRMLQRIWRGHEQQLEHVTIGLNGDERLDLTRLLNKMIAAHSASIVAETTAAD